MGNSRLFLVTLILISSLIILQIDYSQQSFADHGQSQAVVESLAFQYHHVEILGSPVTVGIIDNGFILNNPQFSDNVISSESFGFCFTVACFNDPGDSHGDAVAEVIVDMAPGVELRLYSVLSETDLMNAIDQAIADDVDILNISLGFPEGGGDGTTGLYRDGTSMVAKKS